MYERIARSSSGGMTAKFLAINYVINTNAQLTTWYGNDKNKQDTFQLAAVDLDSVHL